MVTQISLMNFTDQGIRGVKDSAKRASAAAEAAKKFGVTMREIFWTQGAYDIVCILEGPDEQSISAFGLAVAAQGNVRSQSLRAFTKDEMGQILSKLP
jgi:uncharacterized protein with GYD domain